MALVTIDNPPVNSLVEGVIRGLEDVFEKLGSDDETRAVILTGTGKAFAAGADIKSFPSLNRKIAEKLARDVSSMHRSIAEFPYPVIAAINGYALGGGCELAMACDVRIASSKAKFGQPEITLGIIPGAGGTQRLPRLIPTGKAKILLFSGESIGAAEAESIGLVDRVVDDGQEMESARTLAEKIMRNAPIAIRFTKKAVNIRLDMPLNQALMMEAILFGELFEAEDSKEGISAFLEKRKPVYKGK